MNNKRDVLNLKMNEALYTIPLIIKSLTSYISTFVSLYF